MFGNRHFKLRLGSHAHVARATLYHTCVNGTSHVRHDDVASSFVQLLKSSPFVFSSTQMIPFPYHLSPYCLPTSDTASSCILHTNPDLPLAKREWIVKKKVLIKSITQFFNFWFQTKYRDILLMKPRVL